jgi:hypothetical protein
MNECILNELVVVVIFINVPFRFKIMNTPLAKAHLNPLVLGTVETFKYQALIHSKQLYKVGNAFSVFEPLIISSNVIIIDPEHGAIVDA